MFHLSSVSTSKATRLTRFVGVSVLLGVFCGSSYAQRVTRPAGKTPATAPKMEDVPTVSSPVSGPATKGFSKVKIAVVQPKNARSQGDSLITDRLLEIFSSQPRFQLITRDMISDVVGEISLSETGVVSADKNKGFGQIKGVDYLVVGKVNNVSSNPFSHTIVPVQTGETEPKKKKKGGVGGFLGDLFTPSNVLAAREQERQRAEREANQPLPTERWVRSEVAASCIVLEIPSGVVLGSRNIIGRGEAPTDAAAFDAALNDVREQFQNQFVPLIENEIPPVESAITEISTDADDTYIRIKSGKNMGVAPGMMFEIVRVVAKTQMDGSIINDKKVIGYAVATETDDEWTKLAPIKNDAQRSPDSALLGKISNLCVARELRVSPFAKPSL